MDVVQNPRGAMPNRWLKKETEPQARIMYQKGRSSPAYPARAEGKLGPQLGQSIPEQGVAETRVGPSTRQWGWGLRTR